MARRRKHTRFMCGNSFADARYFGEQQRLHTGTNLYRSRSAVTFRVTKEVSDLRVKLTRGKSLDTGETHCLNTPDEKLVYL